MATGTLIKTPENIERFVNMIVLGVGRTEIEKEIGIKPSTYYAWLACPEINDENSTYKAKIIMF